MVLSCSIGCKEFEVNSVVGCLWIYVHIVFSKCDFGGSYVPGGEGYFTCGGHGFCIDCSGGLKGLCSGIAWVWGQLGVVLFTS
uniref:NADH dehydrogenase subunit 4L n=1 Tax=Pomphorhynchus laevis TaxID=141832 RepID=A0A806GRG0_9BILA|nr:NADH dehydrogenase subunit 4L [Pomphorhynchus laevis]